MPLEDLTGPDKFITSLVVTNPTPGDDPVEGDDHIRGEKNVLVNSFPNINAAVTATPAAINQLTPGQLGPNYVTLDGPAGTERYISAYTNGVLRTQVKVASSAPETGANAGSNCNIHQYDDAGNFLRTVLNITRATGNAVFSSNLQAASIDATTSINTSGILYQQGAPAASIGVGQTRQDVTASRAVNTPYTNDTGRPIVVSVTLTTTEPGITTRLVAGGITVAEGYILAEGKVTLSALILPGETYQAGSAAGAVARTVWTEIR